MINRQDIVVDMHVHTVFSRHAYSTLEENLVYAQKAGMKYIAITDHYFHDGTEMAKIHDLYRIKLMEGNVNTFSEVKVIGSAEFNIYQDYEYRETLNMLKWRPIGLHRSFIPTIKQMTYDDLYEGFVQASEWNTGFNHIERELDELCYGKFDELTAEAKAFLEKVVMLAKEKNILLEINEHSLEPRRKYYPIVQFWMGIAAENGNRFCLGTDSHFCREVGQFDKCIDLLNRFGIEKNRVLNCCEDEVRALLRG